MLRASNRAAGEGNALRPASLPNPPYRAAGVGRAAARTSASSAAGS